jgi:hypothetical protein
MHNAALIRLICGKIHGETELEKIDELLRLMRAVIRNDPEDICTRMEFVRKKYAITFDHAIRCRCANAGQS